MKNDLGYKILLTGHIFMIICGLLYLLWWILTFRPGGARQTVDTGHFLLFAALSGLLGLMLILYGLNTPGSPNQPFPAWILLAAGAAGYVVLYFLTAVFLRRPVTTELFLIVGWGMMEAAAVNWVYGTINAYHGMICFLYAGIAVVVIVSLLCYIEYYRLQEMAGYIAGMIPLILVTVWMTGMAGILLKRMAG